MLLAQVDHSIQTRRLLQRSSRILAGISGGVDSMVLLHVLHALSAKHRWKITIAHFNHQLRGRSSHADAALVKKTAIELGLPVVIESGDVKSFAKAGRLSIEMAARKLRHQFLARAARHLGIRTVVLAHHADDQVELFFLRLLRGAGGVGISGMKWKGPSPVDPDIHLIRPFLDVTKAELVRFAQDKNIRYRHDSTNLSLDYQRNRIRHELLPLLRKKYQPATERTVLRAMDIIGAEAEFTTNAAVHWLNQKHRAAFSKLPIALQRRCLQLQLHRLDLPTDFEAVEQLRQAPGSLVNLGPALSVSRNSAGLVQIHTHDTAEFDLNHVDIDLSNSKKTAQFDGLKLEWKTTSAVGKKPPARTNRRIEYFDADKVGKRIVLRHWRPGDRFHPIGMASPVKLQDWFTNRKIKRESRHQLLLATTDDGEIFWVQEQRISEKFKITGDTKRRLEWRWSAL